MTKDEKKAKKKQRKHKRCEKRRLANAEKLEKYKTWTQNGASLWQAKQMAKYGCWEENGRLIQRCDWSGTCNFPCEGDC